MPKQTLKTDFRDDILSASMNGRRRYKIIENTDGTVSLEDVSEYEQVGSNFGASQINASNIQINTINNDLNDQTTNTRFRFGVTEDGKPGYHWEVEGADTVIPFSGGDVSLLYEALENSGLVEKDMTFEEMCASLKEYFLVETISLIQPGWAKSGAGIEGQCYSTTSSVYVSTASSGQALSSVEVIFESPEFNITKYKTVTIKGTSYKNSNGNTEDFYCPLILLVCKNPQTNDDITLFKHRSGAASSSESISVINYDVTNLKGVYALKIVIGVHGNWGNGSYVGLNVAYFSA